MSIGTKTIGELDDNNYKFLIPAYQRGYRWTEYEATALLNDVDVDVDVTLNEILNFGVKKSRSQNNNEAKSKYCIQPLIVKARDDGTYEVVDGQQRLTTIYIIMKIAEQVLNEPKEAPKFGISFETRENSKEFLELLNDDVLKNENEENIDFYHISKVYKAIYKWLPDEKDSDRRLAIAALSSKLRNSVFFIWYELPSDNDPVEMFTRVNLGKIPLTDAELIKALFLNQANFSKDTYKRQTEISIAWDRIEQGLQDDSFWYFLNEKEQSGTRIDMLFSLLAKQKNDELEKKKQISEKQRHFAFLVFSEILSNAPDKEECVKQLWEEIEKIYEEFCEWYRDLDKYHIIGFLIAAGNSIEDIYKATRNKGKTAVIKTLIDKAKKEIKIKGFKEEDSKSLTQLEYGVGDDNKKIRKILLLFNIATLVCMGNKQYRFPFDIYKQEKWDIEHIHATGDIENGEQDGRLCNLTLLDRHTNRSYKDKPFNEKREEILERESMGQFVPVCTKNVFLKVYTSTNEITELDLSNWNEMDKEKYIEKMSEILGTFVEGDFLKKKNKEVI